MLLFTSAIPKTTNSTLISADYFYVTPPTLMVKVPNCTYTESILSLFISATTKAIYSTLISVVFGFYVTLFGTLYLGVLGVQLNGIKSLTIHISDPENYEFGTNIGIFN